MWKENQNPLSTHNH